MDFRASTLTVSPNPRKVIFSTFLKSTFLSSKLKSKVSDIPESNIKLSSTPFTIIGTKIRLLMSLNFILALSAFSSIKPCCPDFKPLISNNINRWIFIK